LKKKKKKEEEEEEEEEEKALQTRLQGKTEPDILL
jgi:hypothetical protein